MNKHILIDGNNLLHRAFHVFVNMDGPSFSSDSGYPTGMIYGPLSMLDNWIPILGRFDAIHYFHDGCPSRRRALDPDYKKRDPNRSSPSSLPPRPLVLSDGFEAQNEIDVLMHVMQLLGVKVYYDPHEEADDLIASFIKSRPDDAHVIISSDKDFFQLLTNPRVAIYRPGSKGPKILDAEEAEKHWALLGKGNHPKVPPECVRMFKALCGDASDNIPGILRLRKKVAVAASIGVENVDGLVNANWPGFSNLERQHAQEMVDRVRLNWDLIGLIDDLDPQPIKCADPDVFAANAILKSLDIHLNTSFLIPKQERMATADVPARVIDDNWASSI